MPDTFDAFSNPNNTVINGALTVKSDLGAGGTSVSFDNGAIQSDGFGDLIVSSIVTTGTGATTNVKGYGALGNGSHDDTSAIQAAITATQTAGGGIVFFPGGIYLINSPLNVTSSKVVLSGTGVASAILLGPSFSGNAAIIATSADDGGIINLMVKGNSSTYSNNVAADGIQLIGSNNWVFEQIRIEYINGWAMKISNTASRNSYFPQLNACYAEKCANGFYFLGTASNNAMGAYLVNCNADQCQVGDCFRFENIYDATAASLEGYLPTSASGSTGSFIHIKGSAFIYLSDMDGGSNQNAPSILIDSGSSGNLSNISISNALIQGGSVGTSIAGGTDIKFVGCEFYKNFTHGVNVSGGTDIVLNACSFNANGQTAGAGHYDLIQSNTGKLLVSNCTFITPQGTSAGQVAQAISANATGTYALNNIFSGANGTNTFTGTPAAARGNVGYNPVGPLTPPAVPSSTVAQTNTFGVDCTVFVTGGTVTVIAIGGTTTGLTSGSFRVPAGQTITITYSVVPTWTWFGD